MATTTKYLLPCECGDRVEVDTTQAGLLVECSCGIKLRVPTLRGLADCERVEQQAEPSTSNWGAGHGLMLLGCVVLLLGAGFAFYCWQIAEYNDQLEFTVGIDREAHRQDVEEMTPGELWIEWVGMPRSLRSIKLENDPLAMRGREMILERFVQRYRRFTWLGVLVSSAGLSLAVLGAVLTFGSGKKR